MKKTGLWVFLSVILLLIVVIAFNSFYVVEENQMACVLRFAKISDVKHEPGLYVKVPFIESVRTYSSAVQIYDIRPSDVISKDKKTMIVDSYVMWKITDPVTFYQTVTNTTEAESRLDALSYNYIKTKFGTLAQDQIISLEDPSNRNEIYDDILMNVKNEATTYGVEVVDVKIKKLDLPVENEDATYRRMISERNKIAQKLLADGEYEAAKMRNDGDLTYNTIISNAKLEAEKIIAEGESEYMRVIAAAYNSPEKLEFYQFMRSLEALKTSMTGGNKTIILDRDSELAKILINP